MNQLQISGIVLSGGNDIGQYKDRERTELKLINYSIIELLNYFNVY